MPEDEALDLVLASPVDLNDEEEIATFAKRFGVSAQAFTYRLANSESRLTAGPALVEDGRLRTSPCRLAPGRPPLAFVADRSPAPRGTMVASAYVALIDETFTTKRQTTPKADTEPRDRRRGRPGSSHEEPGWQSPTLQHPGH